MVAPTVWYCSLDIGSTERAVPTSTPKLGEFRWILPRMSTMVCMVSEGPLRHKAVRKACSAAWSGGIAGASTARLGASLRSGHLTSGSSVQVSHLTGLGKAGLDHIVPMHGDYAPLFLPFNLGSSWWSVQNLKHRNIIMKMRRVGPGGCIGGSQWRGFCRKIGLTCVTSQRDEAFYPWVV